MGTLTVDNLNLAGTSVSQLGKIIQIVQTTKTDTFSTTATTFTDVTGLSASITPSSTSNKVLVMVSSNSSTSGGNNAMMRLARGGTGIFVGDTASSRVLASAQSRVADTNGAVTLTFSFLDTPSTTSATTYQVQYEVQAGTGTINRTQSDTDNANIARTASSIILMEVRA